MLKYRMRVIKETLEKCYGDLAIIISPDSKELAGTNELVTLLVTAPGEPDGTLWTIKIAPSASFVNWEVSEYITEVFKTPEGLEWFIIASDNIYKRLYIMLTKEYEKLDLQYEDTRAELNVALQRALGNPYYAFSGRMSDEEEVYD